VDTALEIQPQIGEQQDGNEFQVRRLRLSGPRSMAASWRLRSASHNEARRTGRLREPPFQPDQALRRQVWMRRQELDD
jgi:hypothetical protein